MTTLPKARNPTILLTIAALLASRITPAHADTATWLNPVSGLWTDATKWSPAVVPNNNAPPGVSYDAFLNSALSGYTVTLGALDVSLNNLFIGPNATLIYNNNSTINHFLSISGSLTIQDGTFTPLGANVVLSNATIISTGTGNVSALADPASPTPSSNLDHVTFGSGANIHLTKALVTNDLLLAATNSTFEGGLVFSTPQSISGAGKLSFGQGLFQVDAPLTIGSSVTLSATNTLSPDQGSRSAQFFGSSSLTNNGTLQTTGVALSITTPSFVNNGAIQATNGTLSIGGTWSNPGTIVLTSSTLNLSGSYSSASFNRIKTTGTVNLTGAIDNEGGTLTLPTSSTSWNGTITGGVITSSSASGIAGSGVLDHVTLRPGIGLQTQTLLFFTASGPSLITNGLRFENAIASLRNGSANAVTANGTMPFTGTGTILYTGNSLLNVAPGFTLPNSMLITSASSSLFLGNVILSGPFIGVINAGSGAWNNFGSVVATSADIAISIAAQTTNNFGLLSATNNAMLILKGNVINAGTISNPGGILVLDAPNLTLANLSAYSNQGVIAFAHTDLQNVGSTISLSAAVTGDFGLFDHSSVTGGLITSADNTTLHILQSKTPVDHDPIILSNVTLAANLVLHNNAILQISQALTLNNASITMGGTAETSLPLTLGRPFGDAMQFGGSATPLLSGTGTITLNAPVSVIGAQNQTSTLTIGPNIVITTGAGSGVIGEANLGAGYFLSNTLNQGIIRVAGPNRTMTLSGNSATNQGVLSAVGGTFLINAISSSSGTITASSLGSIIQNAGAPLTNTGLVFLESQATFTQNTGLVNNGTVSISGQSVFFQKGLFTNNGSLLISSGAGFVRSNTLVNNGTISIDSAFLLFTSTTTPPLAGSVFLNNATTAFVGTLTSASSPFDLGSGPNGAPYLLGSGMSALSLTLTSSAGTPAVIRTPNSPNPTLFDSVTLNTSLLVQPGAILTVTGSFSNAGTITLNSSTLVTASLASPGGTLIRNNAAVLFGGSISSIDTVLGNLPFFGKVDLATGAALSSLTLSSSSGPIGVYPIPTASTTTFSNVTVNADVTVHNGAGLTLSKQITFNNSTIRLGDDAGGATLTLSSGFSFAGTATILFDGIAPSTLSIPNGLSNSLPAGIAIRTGTASGVINNLLDAHGIVSAETPGKSLSIASLGIYGTLTATNGGAIDFSFLAGNYGTVYVGPASSISFSNIVDSANAGLIIVDGGTFSFSSLTQGTNQVIGSLQAVNGATLNFNARLDPRVQTAVACPIFISGDSTANFNAASLDLRAITGDANLTLPSAHSVFSISVTANSLTLGDNSSWSLNPSKAPSFSKLNTLALAHTSSGSTATYSATLQLTKGRLILQTTDSTDKANKILQLNEAIYAGHNGTSNSFLNAKGITSSTVASDPTHLTIGVYDNAALHSLTSPGQPRTDWAGGTGNVDTNSLLLTPALKGDVNLDGIVNVSDLILIAAHFNEFGQSGGISTLDMTHGDVNQDGVVNVSDLILTAGNFNSTSNFNLSPTSELVTPNSELPLPIPEPSSLALLLLTSPFLLRRPTSNSRKKLLPIPQ